MLMRSPILGIVALLAIALTACGGTASSSGPALTVELTDFKFGPATIEILADQKVTLELRNKGAVEHDLSIDAIGLKAIVKPGQTASRSIGPLKAGTTYDVYCSTAGHKESGMVGKLIVK
jgi:uncharacterized cupredoxin-like copper-binding protein